MPAVGIASDPASPCEPGTGACPGRDCGTGAGARDQAGHFASAVAGDCDREPWRDASSPAEVRDVVAVVTAAVERPQCLAVVEVEQGERLPDVLGSLGVVARIVSG